MPPISISLPRSESPLSRGLLSLAKTTAENDRELAQSRSVRDMIRSLPYDQQVKAITPYIQDAKKAIQNNIKNDPVNAAEHNANLVEAVKSLNQVVADLMDRMALNNQNKG